MTAGAPASPVVVGVDGTATTPLAVAWAADYCGTNATPLRLVAAYREDPFHAELQATGAPEDSTDSYPLHAAKRDLDEAAAYGRALEPTLPLETVAIPGPAASILLEEALRAAMVVVGSRRLGRMHRVFSASTGAATAERADCPVVVVREGPSHTLPGTRVVVGVDGPACRGAAEFAFSEARRTGSGVTAVHAWHLNTADLGSLVSPDAERKEMQARGHQILAEVLGPLSAVFPEVDVRRFVVEGTAAEQLEKMSVNARLLVVGSRKLSPLSALVLGSVSRRVISRAHCPVAVLASGSLP
jgi:nucleotide-binding universal stress UspA family protein